MEKRKIKWFTDRDKAFKKCGELTKKNKKSFMVYELPKSIAFAVMETDYFKNNIKKAGYKLEKIGEYQWKSRPKTLSE